MFTDRKYIDSANWITSTTNSRVSGNQTPRSKNKNNIPPLQRKSVTPSKIN